MKNIKLILIVIFLSVPVNAAEIGQYILNRDNITVHNFQYIKDLIKSESLKYRNAASKMNVYIPVSTNTWPTGVYYWSIFRPIMCDWKSHKIMIEVDTRIEKFDKFQNALSAGKIKKIDTTLRPVKDVKDLIQFNANKKEFIDRYIYRVEKSTP